MSGIGTPATIVTSIRTAASIVLAAVAASQDSKTLLVIALLVHWVGDSLDGQVARWFDCETRTGAVLDILSDRLCAAAFYIGLAWLEPTWRRRSSSTSPSSWWSTASSRSASSPGRSPAPTTSTSSTAQLWLLNWSHPGKAVNSGLFAILLLVTGWMWVGLAIALVLLAHKSISLVKLMRLGLPLSGAPLPHLVDAERQFGMDLGSRSLPGAAEPVRR